MSKKKQKHHQEEEAGEAWLLPYSDLMTLLLAVFIVLFAVSQVDQTKADAMAEAFSKNIAGVGNGVMPEKGNSVIKPNIDGIPEVDSSENTESENSTITQEQVEKALGEYEAKKLEELEKEIDQQLKAEEMSGDVTTSIDTRGLVISLKNAILFDSGSADIAPKNQERLIKIALKIKELNKNIRIEGHTDNIPIKNNIYPSNWELSSARASSVVRLFIDKCGISPKKLVPVGYSDTKPIADNKTAKGREKNRRIDIIVLSTKYTNLED
ncbi:OmpA family protein [Anaeromicropila herbilytica]|uniref:Chemotaxis protein MotB n=1 Tax=Anaeromicropila herbilytica TaxID=2785025 RepID=A0A7R7IBX1_9FIRM|nr:OmpA family protein [Anaeromicropila herbilytica]BCN29299.1 chemotaxis protein MotB [Anaeromicropila herbilytica]